MRELKKRMKDVCKNFWREEDAMGTVEIILIVVVLIGLVIVFQGQIGKVVDDTLKRVSSGAGKVK